MPPAAGGHGCVRRSRPGRCVPRSRSRPALARKPPRRPAGSRTACTAFRGRSEVEVALDAGDEVCELAQVNADVGRCVRHRLVGDQEPVDVWVVRHALDDEGHVRRALAEIGNDQSDRRPGHRRNGNGALNRGRSQSRGIQPHFGSRRSGQPHRCQDGQRTPLERDLAGFTPPPNPSRSGLPSHSFPVVHLRMTTQSLPGGPRASAGGGAAGRC